MTTARQVRCFDRVAILGAGLIGGSLALDLRRRGLARRIVAADCRDDVLARVRDLGLADETTANAAEAVRGAGLVILCVPVGALPDVAATVAEELDPAAIVTDVGSSKAQVIARAARHLDMTRFVPGHPIAGAADSGPDAAREGLFEGRWCILTPGDEADPDAVDTVSALWKVLGARVETMAAAQHDTILAVTSHLPHLLSFALMNTANSMEERTDQRMTTYAAGSFADFTRIAAANPTLWRDVFLSNREALLDAADLYLQEQIDFLQMIRNGDSASLLRKITSAAELKRAGSCTVGNF